MQPLPPPVCRYVERWIEAAAPARLAWIAPSAIAPVAAAANALIVTPEALAGAARGAFGRFDLAVVVEPGAGLSRAAGAAMLARLRDFEARQVLVVEHHDAATLGGHAAYIALGFRRAPGSAGVQAGYALYRYDIHDYKHTPSWLNADDWAHPGRWDRERW